MRFRPNRSGINSLMKNPEVGREVERIAGRIASSAESVNGGEFKTDSALGSRRWRAAVIGDYEKQNDAEGTRSALLRGMDGAGSD
ncbi:hypothetical protein [Streptomyces sp. OspMP-M43]|uniref:hypothetical protein n=1 Tax=Streptomyces sp. OspMP-M43 TaxID=1839781 RepID=UPI00081B0D2A|nr:hypothetical protein [Streptomyces sp. OspMP-M43]SCD35497.1 hypothetical protein GA0115261_1000815 [Streptomyces sp. OspMP-M43]